MVTDVIISNEKRVGFGENADDPVRMVWQVFTLDGQLIVEVDPWAQTHLFNQAALDEIMQSKAVE